MSGHSKWHNIQGRKGKQDAMRSGQFTKLSKLITISAKSGGDPATNFSLRLAIEKAKAVSMPKDNIERAIKRGTGELVGEQIEEVLYEGYGAGGIAVLVKCLTDNKNRAVSEVKHIFSGNGGSMAGAGSVQWMFQQLGIVVLKKEDLEQKQIVQDDFELAMVEEGAEDIKNEEGLVEVRTKIENFQKVLAKIKEIGVEPVESGLQWVAKDKVSVNHETEEKLGNLFADLEENDDVEDYFTNAE
ncbi:MAG: YebC/PmpR family DNA-binding transcriptional regulator [Candidatus Magasanikbacteria bacterium]|nr:YebC/PmpR family DNA-binding transcriptional regulator [Candidatus Magasanikbacteria bacterium]